MERENDSHTDKYRRKHLRRETPGEKSPEGRLPQPHSDVWKSRVVQFEHMKETPRSIGKGAPNFVYCHPTEDKGRPCHLDARSACMLLLQRKQKTKDGQEVIHEDHFRCTETLRILRQGWPNEDECHIKRRDSETLKKAEGERGKNAGKSKPEGACHNPGRSPGKGNPGGGRRSSAISQWWKRSTQPDT